MNEERTNDTNEEVKKDSEEGRKKEISILKFNLSLNCLLVTKEIFLNGKKGPLLPGKNNEPPVRNQSFKNPKPPIK